MTHRSAGALIPPDNTRLTFYYQEHATTAGGKGYAGPQKTILKKIIADLRFRGGSYKAQPDLFVHGMRATIERALAELLEKVRSPSPFLCFPFSFFLEKICCNFPSFPSF